MGKVIYIGKLTSREWKARFAPEVPVVEIPPPPPVSVLTEREWRARERRRAHVTKMSLNKKRTPPAGETGGGLG